MPRLDIPLPCFVLCGAINKGLGRNGPAYIAEHPRISGGFASYLTLGVTTVPLPDRFASDIEASLEYRGPIEFSPGESVPTFQKVRHWSHLAKQYLLASDYLRTRDVPLLQPWFQVIGYAIECSVKAYICAVEMAVPMQHDLVKLLDAAIASGLLACKNDVIHVIWINHIYCRDLQSETRYKARFPADRWEPVGGSMPEQQVLTRIVTDFCTQAAAANERNR